MSKADLRPRRQRRDELENHLNRGALWAVTYGDIMSYLMIFFLIMFSFSISKSRPAAASVKYEEGLANIQRVFGGPVDKSRVDRALRRQAEDVAVKNLQAAVESKDLGKFVEVKATEENVQLTLKEPILFDSGKAELKTEAGAVLDGIAAELKALPNAIVVEGHTDDVPIRTGRYASNWELSMARAYAVIRAFEAAGIPAKRLAGAGYGEYQPAADNSTAEGRAKNRRIGIRLARTK